MSRKVRVPSMCPCALIEAIRECIPDDGPIREQGLRQWLPEMDAMIAETRRADLRRYEDVEAA